MRVCESCSSCYYCTTSPTIVVEPTDTMLEGLEPTNTRQAERSKMQLTTSDQTVHSSYYYQLLPAAPLHARLSACSLMQPPSPPPTRRTASHVPSSNRPITSPLPAVATCIICLSTPLPLYAHICRRTRILSSAVDIVCQHTSLLSRVRPSHR